MTSGVHHLFLCLLAFHVSSLGKCQVLCPIFNCVICGCFVFFFFFFAIELYKFFIDLNINNLIIYMVFKYFCRVLK